MNGFGGFVDYSARFLLDAQDVMARLWKMAEALGGGVKYGIDVLEDNGAFVQNALAPISGADYYQRVDDRVYYLLQKGHPKSNKLTKALIRFGAPAINVAKTPICAAFFAPATKILILMRGPKSPPIYYQHNLNTLTFATSASAFPETPKSLEPSSLAVYTPDELKLFLCNFTG